MLAYAHSLVAAHLSIHADQDDHVWSERVAACGEPLWSDTSQDAWPQGSLQPLAGGQAANGHGGGWAAATADGAASTAAIGGPSPAAAAGGPAANAIQLYPESESDQVRVRVPSQPGGKGTEIGIDRLFVKMKGSKTARRTAESGRVGGLFWTNKEMAIAAG